MTTQEAWSTLLLFLVLYDACTCGRYWWDTSVHWNCIYLLMIACGGRPITLFEANLVTGGSSGV